MNKNGVLNRHSRSVFIVRLSFGFMFVMISRLVKMGLRVSVFNSERNRATWNDTRCNKNVNFIANRTFSFIQSENFHWRGAE